jgi:uncharacterized protein
LGLGGPVGSGTQGMSWIHETDMNRLFERALTDSKMNGPYIASSPNPVSQRVFMRTLRRALGMPIGLPAFSWMARLGARWFLRTDPNLALYGRYVVSKRLQDLPFEFQFPELRDALHDLLGRRDRSSRDETWRLAGLQWIAAGARADRRQAIIGLFQAGFGARSLANKSHCVFR